MAWTKPSATFFIIILCLLVTMTVWEIKIPGGAPRLGILRFETTRGDRLFISLLGSAFIHIFWLAFFSLEFVVGAGCSLYLCNMCIYMGVIV